MLITGKQHHSLQYYTTYLAELTLSLKVKLFDQLILTILRKGVHIIERGTTFWTSPSLHRIMMSYITADKDSARAGSDLLLWRLHKWLGFSLYMQHMSNGFIGQSTGEVHTNHHCCFAYITLVLYRIPNGLLECHKSKR